jgi:hypothetical protein
MLMLDYPRYFALFNLVCQFQCDTTVANQKYLLGTCQTTLEVQHTLGVTYTDHIRVVAYQLNDNKKTVTGLLI